MVIFFLNFISAANSVSLIRNNTWSANLSGVFHSSLVLGDIDNDGDYDMVAMGCTAGGVDTCTTADKIRVYTNNGTTFNENSTWGSNTTNLGYGSLALGDIDNDGDLDLAVLGDKGGASGDVKIYTNNGTTFNENLIWELNLSSIDAFAGSLAFGDIDNDGDLDLALVGASPSSNNGIYINNGTSFIKDSNWLTGVPYVGHGLGMGSLAFGDVDNDGDLDLVFIGSRSTNWYRGIYINNGTSLVDNSSWKGDFTASGWPSLILGDFDNDGDLDLVEIGTRTGDHQKFYNNTGSNFSLIQTTGAYFDGSIGFGDFDNDGDLDLASMGKESGRNRIRTNNNTVFGHDIFEQQDMHDDNMQQGSLAWIDVNNDTNIDLIINGKQGNSAVYNFTVYISNASSTKNNTQPTPPNTFSSSYSDGVLNLTWNNGSDAETNSTGLYYNLMVGNSSDNHTVVSGVYGGSSNPTAGYFGNMMQRKNISLNKYLNGTYYWYVQTIDTGLRKSNWSARQSIVVGADTDVPTISSVSPSVTHSTATITWTTNESANSTVHYGITNATTSSSGLDDLVIPHSISLSGLSASTLYYYNVSSCDYWNNCNTSIQYTFTTSAAPTNGGSPGGGGGNGGTTPTITPELPEFDMDFSTSTSGSFEVEQGDIKTFSFQGEVKHNIAVMAITSNSMTLLITSEPITIQILLGEIKQIDMNKDEINDLEIKLISITNGKAKFIITKLEGADIVGEEELGKEALFDVRVSIVNLFQIVKSGKEVIAEIEVFNVNNIGQVDVMVDYYITSKEDNLTKVVEGSDTLAVEAVASFVRNLAVPYNLKSGKYLFNVDISYGDEIMASGNTEFRVIKSYWIIIGVGVIVLIIAGIFFYLWKIKRKEEKDVGKLKSKERKDIGLLKKELGKLKKRKRRKHGSHKNRR